MYLNISNAKEPWDALEAMFGATDVGNGLYAMKQFHDLRIVNNNPVVEQTHKIQCIAKELELLRRGLLDKFIAVCIIANQVGHSVPLNRFVRCFGSWRNSVIRIC